MIPINVPANEHCYCERNDWQRMVGQGGSELVLCNFCGYVAVIVLPPAPPTEGNDSND
jgi:hypothetical protein